MSIAVQRGMNARSDTRTERDNRGYRGNRGDECPPPDQARVLTIRMSTIFGQFSIRNLDHCISENSFEARPVPRLFEGQVRVSRKVAKVSVARH